MNIRGFPEPLLRELNAESAKRGNTLREYVIWLLSRRNYTLRALGEHRLLDAKEEDNGTE